VDGLIALEALDRVGRIADALAPEEQARLVAHLAQGIETGGGVRRSAVAYSTARKPSSWSQGRGR
jgi:hypothetical protein